MSNGNARPNQREHILDAALRLMSEHGASGVSMRQLARACDLNVASLYHYFESKDALLAAVIDERRYGARLAEPPAIDADLPAADRLRIAFTTVWDGALAEEPVWRLLLGEGIRGEEAAIGVGRSLLTFLRPGLAAWVGNALPELADPEAVADLMLGQMFSGFVRHIFEPDVDVAVLAHDGADALVRVVLNTPSPAGSGSAV